MSKRSVSSVDQNTVQASDTVKYLFILALGIFIAKPIFRLNYFNSLLSYGLALNIILFYLISKKLSDIKQQNKRKAIFLSELMNTINLIAKIFYAIFAAFSTFIFILVATDITSTIFSGIWLLLLIFFFQISIFWFILYLIQKRKSTKLIKTIFLITYLLLSAMFGWTSARLAHDVIHIPMVLDLIIATYGTLILPFIFVKVLDRLNK